MMMAVLVTSSRVTAHRESGQIFHPPWPFCVFPLFIASHPILNISALLPCYNRANCGIVTKTQDVSSENCKAFSI